MKNTIIYIVLFLCVFNTTQAQQTPADAQTNDYTIEGATAHIGDGTIIENSLLMFSNGRLIFVGSVDVKIGRIGTIIQAKGKHVYPGFIAVNTTLGLAEIDAVKATRDIDEIGALNPHIRSIIAYNAESKVVESMRPNGVLVAQITPRGGLISGTSSVVQLDAWNWEDATVKTDGGIHLNWPSSFSRGRWWLHEDTTLKPSKQYQKTVTRISDYFKQAKNYLNGKKTPKHLPYESVAGLFDGSQKLFVHANGNKEITDAVHVLKELGISQMVLVNGAAAEQVSDVLVQYNIPVVLQRAHRLPSAEDEDYDYPFRMAKILSDKGILVGIGMEGSMERMSTRNLPFYAGTYAAYGLDKEKAVQLITQNNAKILGIESQMGTLTTGKDATLFISEGDALDMRTNILSAAFIKGRKISLESHQTALWKRYSKKYKQQ